MHKDIESIIEYLQGTTRTLDEACQQHGFEWEELTEKDHAKIDENIFLCPTCGWWCETSEANESESGEDVCDDCKEDEEE